SVFVGSLYRGPRRQARLLVALGGSGVRLRHAPETPSFDLARDRDLFDDAGRRRANSVVRVECPRGRVVPRRATGVVAQMADGVPRPRDVVRVVSHSASVCARATGTSGNAR